ncbi:MAG: MinD/ParA family protein [Myxococcales bacterium]|nr:MinD/ParA family protein [Myxococcales bacterium]
MAESTRNASETAAPQPERPLVCCVGGGKGGTGKSVVSLNLARQLAKEGFKVVLADLDLGGANLHILAGVEHPRGTLRDFFGGRVESLVDLLTPVPQMQIHLIAGGDEAAGVVQPGAARKQKLVRHLRRLDADVVVCDLGGNSSLDTLDLFHLSHFGVLVTTPEPTAVKNTYGFMKAALLRRLWRACPPHSACRALLDRVWDPESTDVDMSILELLQKLRAESPDHAQQVERAHAGWTLDLVVNMVDPELGERVYQGLASVAQRFLDLRLNLLGHVPTDESLRESILRGQPPLLNRPGFAVRLWERVAGAFEPGMAVGVNEEIRFRDEVLHIQTEDLGPEAAAYLTLVYMGGRVLLSKRVEWSSSFFERAGSSLRQERVRFLHRTVVQAILSGRIPLTLPGAEGKRPGNADTEGERPRP